jgi:hypothetical protein
MKRALAAGATGFKLSQERQGFLLDEVGVLAHEPNRSLNFQVSGIG